MITVRAPAVLGLIFFTVFLLYLNGFLPDGLSNYMMSSKNEIENSVIVVGAGLAGLTAAIEAVKHGATVTIIDKEPNVGGNSAKATSGINGAETSVQYKNNIEDLIEVFMRDTIASGDGLSNIDLVQTLTQSSAQAIDFLLDLNLKLDTVVQLGGHSRPRTHRFSSRPDGRPQPVGWTIISRLKKYIESELKKSVEIKTNTELKDMQIDLDGQDPLTLKVKTGSNNEEIKTMTADAVILATGGYANDHSKDSLLKAHVPHLASFSTTNGKWATGDTLKIGEKIGLSLIHMDHVQTHPTGFVDPKDPTARTKFLAPEALRGYGAILLTPHTGVRFVNELDRRDRVTEAIMKNCRHYQEKKDNPVVAVMLMNQKVLSQFGMPSANFYITKGLIKKVDNLQSLSKTLSIEEKALKEAITEYNDDGSRNADVFGKTYFPVSFDVNNDRFYYSFITPSIHYCMGGLEIDNASRVLHKQQFSEGDDPEISSDSRIVPGLFAAGEVTGGLHGNNRLGGNSLLECVVFGRIAGQHAAHFERYK